MVMQDKISDSDSDSDASSCSVARRSRNSDRDERKKSLVTKRPIEMSLMINDDNETSFFFLMKRQPFLCADTFRE